MKMKIEEIIANHCLDEKDPELAAEIRDLIFPDPDPAALSMDSIYPDLDVKKTIESCYMLTKEFSRGVSVIPGNVVSILNGTHPAISGKQEVVFAISSMVLSHVLLVEMIKGR